MLTYQLHTRILHVDPSKKITFPNSVKLEIKFSPGTAFGTEDIPSRTLVRAHAATLTMNANTGRWFVQSKPPLEPLNVVIDSTNSKFNISGDQLTYEFQCSNIEQLDSMLRAMKWVYPTLLNLSFSEPPIVLSISGMIGDVKFQWEHLSNEWQIMMTPVTEEGLEKEIVNSFDKLSLFNGTQNRRLAAALTYFHIAVRLNVCGDSPWEFMAEIILNYCKVLDILFVNSENSREDVRRGLEKLNYSAEEIEGDFIPLLILRSYVDVAHPKVSLFKRDDLKVLYKFVYQSENKIRELLNRLIAALIEKRYIFIEEDLKLSSKDRKGMDDLVRTMSSRILNYKVMNKQI